MRCSKSPPESGLLSFSQVLSPDSPTIHQDKFRPRVQATSSRLEQDTKPCSHLTATNHHALKR
nr:MAG TPA: hypothetical protein [Caudoviricetes sp.]